MLKFILVTDEKGNWLNSHQVEAELIKAALKEVNGRIDKAAKLISMPPTTIRRKLSVFDINYKDYRKGN